MNDESLFAEAVALKAEARAAFLDLHCKGNAGLRKDVEALLRAHEKPDPFFEPSPVAGATLGLIGVGSIGGRVARIAASLGMRVIAVREHPEKGTPDGVEQVFPLTELDQLLGQSDFVVLAAPLLAATERLINADRLAHMKPSGYLINVGRGPQVDQLALVEALRTRQIAGAALDVFDREPLPADSPLWNLDNLLITPHTAGLTDKLWQRHYELFSENLRRYIAGEPLLYVVDKHKGY